jgi:tetratricopeptide (TPR) repeat protein
MRFMLVITVLQVAFAASVVHAAPPTTADSLPAIAEGDWAAAELILSDVLEANPNDGMAHYYLAASFDRLGECHNAIPHFDQALELGANAGRNGMRRAVLGRAKCEATLGLDNEAIASLEQAWRNWGFDDFASIIEDEAFSALARTPAFRELAGWTDATDRTSRWQADIDYYGRLVIETHPDPFHTAHAENWLRELSELRGQVPDLTDNEIVSGLMHLASMIGDGHTTTYFPFQGEGACSLVPIYPIQLADGWYILSVPDEYIDIIGARIVGAGDLCMAELMIFAREHLPADNRYTADWLAGLLLQTYEFYELAGALDSDGDVVLRLATQDGAALSRRLSPTEIDRNPNDRTAPENWTNMYGQSNNESLWLRERDHTHCRAELSPGIIYAHVNQIADDEGRSLAEFGEQLLTQLRETEAQALILDLRHNNGGNANLARPLVRSLMNYPPLTEQGSLYVLTGPRSYSATMYLIGALEQYFNPIQIGRPTGGRPSFYSTERGFSLPYSGIEGSISARMHIDNFSADDHRPAFFPDYLIWPRGADVREGEDPVLDLAVELAR